MNILHIIMSFNTGGAETLLIDLLNNNKSINQNIIIVNKSYNKYLLDKINSKDVVKLVNRPEGSKNITYIIKIIKLVYELNPDIIHCHNVSSFKIALCLKKIFRDIKVVYTIHDTNIIKENSFLISKINRYCDKVICISDSVETECLNYGIKSYKVSKIYNGIDIEKFNIKKNKHNSINIACIARLFPSKKGQDILIRSIKEIECEYDINVFFAGDVIEENGIKRIEDLKKLKDLSKELGIENKIHFCGNIKDIPEFLKNIDILVLPSRYEGFGLVLIEAMAAKIPVIASEVDGPKDIIKNKYGYLFKTNDHKQLSFKIVECIEKYGTITEGAYKYVCENYSIEKMYYNYNKLYTECFKEKYEKR